MEDSSFFGRWFPEGSFRQYLAAAVSAGAALALQIVFPKLVDEFDPYTTLFVATAFSVWYAGMRPSLLTASLGWLGTKCLFIPPLYSLRIATREERTSAMAYSLVSLAIILFGGLSRTAMKKQREVQRRLLTNQKDLERRIRQRTSLLGASNDRLRDLTAQLLKVRDQEQRRIARHLHDSTGQTILVLTMNLRRLEREAQGLSTSVVQTAAESASLAKEISDSVRTVSYLLHPPLLDKVGLKSALAWYAGGFEDRSGIKVHLEIPSDLERQPLDLEIAVFRIVQECLTNIHRHSASTTANIRLFQFAGGLALEVRDAGRGEYRARCWPGSLPLGYRGWA
jgi:signal transduction histidine kinase